METVRVLAWYQEDCAEPASWYRIDEPGEGDRFFRDLKNNAENDGREKFEYKEVTSDEWAKAEKVGLELA